MVCVVILRFWILKNIFRKITLAKEALKSNIHLRIFSSGLFGNATRLGEMLKNGLNWYMIHNGLFLHWMASDAWFKAFNFVGLIKIHVNGMSVIWDSIHQKFPPAQDVAIESLLWFCVLIKLCFPINAPCQKLGWCTNVSHAHGLDHVWSLKGPFLITFP